MNATSDRRVSDRQGDDPLVRDARPTPRLSEHLQRPESRLTSPAAPAGRPFPKCKYEHRVDQGAVSLQKLHFSISWAAPSKPAFWPVRFRLMTDCEIVTLLVRHNCYAVEASTDRIDLSALILACGLQRRDDLRCKLAPARKRAMAMCRRHSLPASTPTQRIYEGYRRGWREAGRGHDVPIDRLAYAALVYVGETEARAHAGA